MNLEPMTKSRQVHQTSDYSMFRAISGNRKLNRLHLKRIANSMKERYLFTIITVNEHYHIIDGQHRFEACRELKLPINYVVCEGYGLDEVHILNENSKTWNANDYLDGYCELLKPDYLVYRDFKKQFGFGHGECMMMLAGAKTSSGSLYERFRNGTFKVKNIALAKKRAYMIESLGQFYEGYKRRSFVYALNDLFQNPNFSFMEFVGKLKLQRSALYDCASKSQYTELIESIYNNRRRSKVNLRFSSK